MVQSGAANVDAFMAGVEPERIEALKQMRAACLRAFPDWEERMQWGMPGYGPAGSDARVSFNNQKNYVSLYAGRDAVERYRSELKGATFGKGCVRFPRPGAIDFAVVGKVLDHAYKVKGGAKGAGCA